MIEKIPERNTEEITQFEKLRIEEWVLSDTIWVLQLCTNESIKRLTQWKLL